MKNRGPCKSLGRFPKNDGSGENGLDGHSQADKDFPGKFESRNLSRETLSRETGRTTIYIYIYIYIYIL